jgi:pyruvate/2-oxoglutarate dehydrogenase complex dihydrolipoamide acyltransferase (E2) component
VFAVTADRFASSAARELAVQLGLAEVAIVGTGRNGRVTVADVRRLAPPDAPAGLGEAGRAFWLAVRREWKLRADEDVLLLAACRTLDELAPLERALADASPVVAGSRGQVRPHPLIAEVRAHRLALRQLLAALGLAEADASSGDAAVRAASARSSAGRQLARHRWRPRG